MYYNNNKICLYNNKKIKLYTKMPNLYRVELSLFNITPGIPGKPYTIDDYNIAQQNIVGINNAISYASLNNYDGIILPQNFYSLCYVANEYGDDKYQRHIYIDKNNFTVDFNDSTFKVIYCSEGGNPFTPDVTYEPVKSADATIFVICDCKNSVMKNCTIIGDKIDRSFTEQAEKAVEKTYGIHVGSNCMDIKVLNIDSSLFMGDSITSGPGFGTNATIESAYSMEWTNSELDSSGNLIASETYMCSHYIPLDTSNEYFFMHGVGYSQGITLLKKKYFWVAYYGVNKNFLRKELYYVLKPIPIYKDCKYIILQIEETEYDSTTWWNMTLKYGVYGENILISNCYIHHNHRGGISGGVNSFNIIGNRFYKNGASYDDDNNLPGFEQANGSLYMTRYSINMEDSQAWDLNIHDNTYYGSRIGIAARGMSSCIKNENLLECDFGIVLYSMRACIIQNCKSSLSIGNYDIESIPLRDYDISNNEFTNVEIKGTSPITSFTNNTISGTYYRQETTPIYNEENNKLTNKEMTFFSDFIYLGKNDSPDNYEEVGREKS